MPYDYEYGSTYYNMHMVYGIYVHNIHMYDV